MIDETKLARLVHLYEIVFPIAEKHEVDLDCFEHCLLGYAVNTEQLRADGWEWRQHNPSGALPAWKQYLGINAAAQYYKLPMVQAKRLFSGTGNFGLETLQERKYDLRELIETERKRMDLL